MNSEQILDFYPMEIINNSDSLSDANSIKNSNHTTKKDLLKQKRKREEENNLNNIIFLKDRIKSEQNKSKEKVLSKENNKENLEHINNIKTTIYDIPPNLLAIIFSYLNLDQLFLLKNIGAKNIKQAILNLFEFISENKKNYFSMVSIKTNDKFLKQMKLLKYDFNMCKKYFMENKFKGEILPKNKNIKYSLYNTEKNKNYFLFHHIYYIFCSADIDSDELDEEFRLENDYYEKFQFINLSNNQNEVVFFGMSKISIYQLTTKNKILNLYTPRACGDFLLYNKELNIFILPCHDKSIKFYEINNKNTKKKTVSLKKDYINDKENIEIIDIGKITQEKIIKYLLCIYSQNKDNNSNLIIYNYKDFVAEKEIKSLNGIINISSNKEYLLIYMNNGKLNYYDLTKNDYNFVGFFDFNILCNDINQIKFVSLINYKILNNVFIVLKKTSDKNKMKVCFIYIEKYKNKNGFNYMVLPLSTLENDIFEDGLIDSKFTEEKINGETVIKILFFVYNFNIDDNNKAKKRTKHCSIDENITALTQIYTQIPLDISFN